MPFKKKRWLIPSMQSSKYASRVSNPHIEERTPARKSNSFVARVRRLWRYTRPSPELLIGSRGRLTPVVVRIV